MRLSRRRFLGWLGGLVGAVAVPVRAAAAQRTLEVICRRAWEARRPTGGFRRHRIRRITVHHSAVVLRNNRLAPSRLRSHQAAHQDRGWSDIAYHLLIDRNGNVYEGRPRWAVGDTATNYDPRGHLLVMCEGNFQEQRPSPAQVRALVDVLAWAVERHEVGVRTIRGHLELADTACPGRALQRRLGAVRRRVRERLEGGGVRLVELCGEAGRDRVEAIEAGEA
ncbi:MAG: peptidoglycan recognition protein family protein [Actinomycetota bacterium]